MKRYDYLSCKVAESCLEKAKMAARFRKLTNKIDEINEFEDEINTIYRNFKIKNVAIILYNLPVLVDSLNLISRTFGGSVSDVNLMRKISIKLEELKKGIDKMDFNDSGSDKEFKKHKQDLKKIHLQVKRLT